MYSLGLYTDTITLEFNWSNEESMIAMEEAILTSEPELFYDDDTLELLTYRQVDDKWTVVCSHVWKNGAWENVEQSRRGNDVSSN